MNISKFKIENLLARKSLTKSIVADRSGLSRQAFSTILQRGTCSPISAGKISQALGVDVSEISEKAAR